MANNKSNIYFQFYFWLLVFIAISLPLSKYTMSVGSLLLLTLWLCGDFQGEVVGRFYRRKGVIFGSLLLLKYLIRLWKQNFLEKGRKFLNNKAAVVLASIYLLHIVGMFYTSDFSYGISDLRIKLPLLFFPLVFSTMEKLDYSHFRKLLLYYLGALFFATLIGAIILIRGNFLDIRNISPYISSIRLGLNLSFGFFILLYFITTDPFFKRKQKPVMVLLSLWFVVFLFLMESITSLSIIFVVGLVYMIYLVFKNKKPVLNILLILIIIALPAFFYLYVNRVVHESITPSPAQTAQLDKYTALGNPYTFDTINMGVEDGKYIGLYLCEPELEKAWNQRSKLKYNGKDKRGDALKETLIRFLTSINLRKDAAGVKALTADEVKMVENGIANYNYIDSPGLHSRILKMIKGYEVYKKTGNPSGNSTLQRFEYLKASLAIIKNNLWFGVGTGDFQDAFYSQYSAMHSHLTPPFMLHVHNQYLAFFVTFGLFGFLFFLFVLAYPVIATRSYRDYFFVVFYLIMLLSMFSDNTLETHAGATLFAFFSSLILFGKQRENT